MEEGEWDVVDGWMVLKDVGGDVLGERNLLEAIETGFFEC